MKANRSMPTATVVPVLNSADVRATVLWLSEAFGFVERVRIGGGHRSQLQVGDAAVVIAAAHGDLLAAQRGETTHSVMVRVEGADAHYKKARAAGARIVMELTTFEFGERQYTAEDPDGHQWTFSETVADVAPKDWGGQTIGAE